MSELRRRVPPSWSLGFLLALLACGSPRAVPLDRTSHEVREVRLVPGASHVYRIFLEAGEYLALRIDQPSVDVVVSFYDPEGRKLLGIDNWSGADGTGAPETVHWVAEKAGEFRVGVEAGKKIRGGIYTLRLEELHPATEQDRRRVKAELAFSDGDVLNGSKTTRRQALTEYEKALAELKHLGDRNRQADALFRLAETRDDLGEIDEAVRLYGVAFELYGAAGNERQRALCLQHRSFARSRRYEIEETLADLERVLPMWERLGERRGRAMVLNNLGVNFHALGELDSALAAFEEALELWPELDDRLQEARTFYNRGLVYASLQRSEPAVADFSKALAVRRESGTPADVARVLNALGEFYLGLKDPERALDSFRQTLELDGAPPSDRALAVALAGSGYSRVELGAWDEGAAALREALGRFRALGDRALEAWTENALGRAASLRGNDSEARAHLDSALAVNEEIHNRAGRAAVLRELAEAERRRGALGPARAFAEAALGQLEDLRARVPGGGAEDDALRAEFLATRQSYYDLYVDLLQLEGLDAEALEANERARARSLVELLSRASLSVPETRLFELERDLARRINAAELRLRRLRPLPPRIVEEQDELIRRYEHVRLRIRSSAPHYAALTRPEVPTAQEIRNLLDPETLLLEYKLGEERGYLWAVTRDSVRAFHLPARRQVEAAVRQAYEGIAANRRQSRERVEILLAELGDLLLEPLREDRLGAVRRLVFVADGALHFLPFAALTGPESEPLVARYEIVALPSASALKVLREQVADRRPAEGTLAIVADPAYGGAYPRLAHSGAEAAALAALVPPEERFVALGPAASRDAFASGVLGRYRLLHLAAHGEIDTEDPGLSHLVLALVSEDGRPRGDGRLYTREIYGLDLSAELVVLSACRTALGKPIRGEGFVGWTRGFMYAGAPRVVVSLWNVDDESTAVLMARFYHELLEKGSPPSAALRSAQESVRSEPRFQAPFHWAGFVLQGEWRDISRKRH